jgi:hypothetical protein
MTFDEALAYFSDDSIDILHIDGHHSYESVRSDFESWLPKVRPGGIILLHDICIRTAGFGVWRFWEELAASLPHFAFKHGAGLGVVVKPGGERPDQILCTLLSADSNEQVRIGRYYAGLAERFQLEFDNTELRKTTSNRACPVQLYISFGQGYAEENSVIRVTQVGRREDITFELPAGIPASPLRIDPADRPCIIEFLAIVVSTADRSDILWKWDCTCPIPPLTVGGTARLLSSGTGIAILSDGIDPQVFFPEIGGESFDRPLAVELLLQITACVEFNGAIVPLGDIGGGVASLQGVQRETRSLPEELVQEVDRKSANMVHLLTEETSRMIGALGMARADTLAAKAEILGHLAQESARVRAEFERLGAEAQAAKTEILELRTRLQNARRRYSDLEQSWSWRLTAPVRYVLNRLQRNRQTNRLGKTQT